LPFSSTFITEVSLIPPPSFFLDKSLPLLTCEANSASPFFALKNRDPAPAAHPPFSFGGLRIQNLLGADLPVNGMSSCPLPPGADPPTSPGLPAWPK
jgi:hypothetical protein